MGMYSASWASLCDLIKTAEVSFPAGHPGAGLFATRKPAMLPRKAAVMARSAPVGAAPKPDVSRGALSAGAQIPSQPITPRSGPLDFSGKVAFIQEATTTAFFDELSKIAMGTMPPPGFSPKARMLTPAGVHANTSAPVAAAPPSGPSLSPAQAVAKASAGGYPGMRMGR